MFAKYLAAHPEGVLPTGMPFTPSTIAYADPKDDPGYYSLLQELQRTTYSRFITNSPVSLKEPFDFSLVEKKTLKALGVDRLDYKVTTERKRIVPKSRAAKDKLKQEEERRLAELAAKKQFATIFVA
ncbi:hypothetical protein J3R82DRAFT_9703 [Butyriboletus roseoflavus]|nr:hypothetical protein J3R82DRAFT_9703 [Butyriboletus roseoflavus]